MSRSFAGVIAVLCLIVLGCESEVDYAADPGALQCKLALKPRGKPGEVVVTFINTSPKVAPILTWLLIPGGAMTSQVFDVACNGQPCDYTGESIKRRSPTSGDYTKLRPNSAISQNVDLSTNFDMTRSGDYTVFYLAFNAQNGQVFKLQSNEVRFRVE